jgi:NAD(P)-dependent dehydrogenase (short-subunit alcohol dehydrogenase family)
MSKGHQDKIAVITGASAGIGQACAKRLAQDGAHIVMADIKPAQETAKLVAQAGREALYCRCDVTSPDDVTALAGAVEKRFGRCDILLNNAGIYPIQPFEQMTFADWRRVMAINLDAPFLLCAAFAPGMRTRGWGRIVNMASDTVNLVILGYTHYIASKAGLIGMTRALATELGPHGITVNAIAPSLTRTPGTLSRAPRPGRSSIEEDYTFVANLQAIKRGQVPEDIVGAVSFLASDDAAFITGQTLYVDGGMVRV